MKTFKTFLALAFAALFSINASAAGFATAKIVAVQTMSNGATFFYLTTNLSGGPVCGASYVNRIATDATAAVGKMLADALLAAALTGKVVTLYGTGACSVSSDTETLYYAIVTQ